MTSNAPTVESAHLPDDYKPGQAYWSEKTRWDWAHQTRGGVVVGRCDYADQYKFQHRPSDVPAAVRDLVVVPWADGTDASVVVIDRAKSGEGKRGLHLKFRTPGTLALDGDVATATVGGSALSIRRLASSSGKPALGRSKQKDCFSAPATRGNCDAGRFPVTDLRLVVDGPAMEAVHVIDATGKGTPAATARLEKGTGWQGIWLERKDGAAMVVYGAPAKALAYTAPAKRAVHVVVDAPADKGGKATVTATKAGDTCKISIRPGRRDVGEARRVHPRRSVRGRRGRRHDRRPDDRRHAGRGRRRRRRWRGRRRRLVGAGQQRRGRLAVDPRPQRPAHRLLRRAEHARLTDRAQRVGPRGTPRLPAPPPALTRAIRTVSYR